MQHSHLNRTIVQGFMNICFFKIQVKGVPRVTVETVAVTEIVVKTKETVTMTAIVHMAITAVPTTVLVLVLIVPTTAVLLSNGIFNKPGTPALPGESISHRLDLINLNIV